MTHRETEDLFLEIKEKIKAGMIESSLKHLEQFLAELGDSDELDKLDDKLMILSSHFSILKKEKLLGVITNVEGEKLKGKLIEDLVSLLKAVKRVVMA